MKTRDVVQVPDYGFVLGLARRGRPWAKSVLEWLDSPLEDGLGDFETGKVQCGLVALPGFGQKTLEGLRNHLRMVGDDLRAPPEVVRQDACQNCAFWEEAFVVNETNVPESAGTGTCRRFDRCTAAASVCSGFNAK